LAFIEISLSDFFASYCTISDYRIQKGCTDQAKKQGDFMEPVKQNIFPPLGMRTIKTGICVAACLLVNQFLFTQDIALYSCFAAIVCMQSTIESTVKTGINRLIGTAIGGGLGIFLLFLVSFSAYVQLNMFVFLPLGIIASIYLCTAIRRPGSATIAAIVLLSIFVLPYGGSESPYLNALQRIVGTVIGVLMATAINRIIAPARSKDPRDAGGEGFGSLYRRYADSLSEKEVLILYANPNKNPIKKGRGPRQRCPGITIPVPLPHCDLKNIETAYITEEGRLHHLTLKNQEGFISLPGSALPCTVYWSPAERPAFLPR
jgi:hypothetical protein